MQYLPSRTPRVVAQMSQDVSVSLRTGLWNMIMLSMTARFQGSHNYDNCSKYTERNSVFLLELIDTLIESSSKWCFKIGAPQLTYPIPISFFSKSKVKQAYAFHATTICLKNSLFWDMTPCSMLKAYRRFDGICLLQFQGRRLSQSRKQCAAGSKRKN